MADSTKYEYQYNLLLQKNKAFVFVHIFYPVLCVSLTNDPVNNISVTFLSRYAKLLVIRFSFTYLLLP